MINAPLQRACELAGGQTALASAIGVRQSTLSYWLHHARRGAPAEFAPLIEFATDGRVTRGELRPDLWDSAVSMLGEADHPVI